VFCGQRFDVPDLLSVFDIFVLSSVLEGLPRVVIEAMAMERAIVATDIEGAREQIDHETTGLLVPKANPTALAEAVLRLLNNPVEAQRLAKAARNRAEELFDLNKTILSVEALYQRLTLK